MGGYYLDSYFLTFFKMRKIIFGLLALATFGVTTAMAVNYSFSDVSTKDWFYKGVTYSAATGLMEGYSSGKFGPNDAVTRAQLATVLSRIHPEIYAELLALRKFDVMQLTGSSWEKYKSAYERFPVDGTADIAYEGSPVYEAVKDKLITLASDKTDEHKILSGGKNSGYFFISEYTDIAGDRVYGPFFDDVNRIVSEFKW